MSTLWIIIYIPPFGGVLCYFLLKQYFTQFCTTDFLLHETSHPISAISHTATIIQPTLSTFSFETYWTVKFKNLNPTISCQPLWPNQFCRQLPAAYRNRGENVHLVCKCASSLVYDYLIYQWSLTLPPYHLISTTSISVQLSYVRPFKLL